MGFRWKWARKEEEEKKKRRKEEKKKEEKKKKRRKKNKKEEERLTKIFGGFKSMWEAPIRWRKRIPSAIFIPTSTRLCRVTSPKKFDVMSVVRLPSIFLMRIPEVAST